MVRGWRQPRAPHTRQSAGDGSASPGADRLSPRTVRFLRWVQVVALAAALLSAWAIQVGVGARPGEALSTAWRTVREAATAALPAGSVASGPRLLAPDFELALFEGGSLRLADVRGQGVVLNFWASWCVPCRQEAPNFARAAAAFDGRGVVFVGVDIQDIESDARAFLAEFGIRYANGADNAGRIAGDYGIVGIPTTVFIDADGRIARRWLGVLNEQQLTGFVREILP